MFLLRKVCRKSRPPVYKSCWITENLQSLTGFDCFWNAEEDLLLYSWIIRPLEQKSDPDSFLVSTSFFPQRYLTHFSPPRLFWKTPSLGSVILQSFFPPLHYKITLISLALSPSGLFITIVWLPAEPCGSIELEMVAVHRKVLFMIPLVDYLALDLCRTTFVTQPSWTWDSWTKH